MQVLVSRQTGEVDPSTHMDGLRVNGDLSKVLVMLEIQSAVRGRPNPK
jgi:hypothetical protein